MASVKCVLAFMALAMVASMRVGADLSDNCRNLARKLASSDVDTKDEEQVFADAKWHLLTKVNPFSALNRKRLVSAWDYVIHEDKCSPDSLHKLSVIANCGPNWPSMKTLYDPFKSHVARCITPVMFEDMMRSKSVGLIYTAMYGNLTKFMGPQFLEDFRASNPDEPPVDLTIHRDPNCCLAENAISSIKLAIERNSSNSEVSLKDKFSNVWMLWIYLNRHLFGPCEAFVRVFRRMMVDLRSIGRFMDGGEGRLIAQMSSKARDDVFRYRLCERMIWRKEYKDVADMVFEKL